MADDRPLVWMPFERDDLGDPPAGLRYETVRPRPATTCPPRWTRCEFYVPAVRPRGRARASVLARMPRLEVVQTLTAGVDHIRGQVPEGVLLCNGRGIHNASTAELALTLTLASLRGIPGFVGDQHEDQVAPGLAAVAGRLDRADRRVRRHRP